MRDIKLIRKIQSHLREHGLLGLWREALSRVYERTEFVVMQRDLRDPPMEVRCAVPFLLRRIGDDEISRFKDMPAPFPRNYQYRFDYGQRHCYGAFVGDRIVALMWPVFHADNKRVVSRWRLLLPDEARLSSIWADPEFRGTGLMDACIEKFAVFLKEQGYRYLYAMTWVGNESSIRLHKRRGFVIAGKAARHSFRWQKDGHGFYVRDKIVRESFRDTHQTKDSNLPEFIR